MHDSPRRQVLRPADERSLRTGRRRALVSVPIASLATLALVLGAPGAANADDNGGGLLGRVGSTVEKTVKPVTDTVHRAATPRPDTPPPSKGTTSRGSAPSSSGSSGSSTRRPVRDTVRKVTTGVTSRSTGLGTGSRTSSSSSATSGSAGTSTRKAPARRTSTRPATTSTGTAGSGKVADVDLAKRNLLDLSGSAADGSPSSAASSATLVGLAGRPLIGSSATSTGGSQQASGPVPGNPLCQKSMGTLCLDALYADSTAQAGAGSSSSSSRTGVADTCVLGDDASGADCDGVELGVARSDAQQRTGSAGSTSTGSSALTDLCVPGPSVNGDDCALGLDVLSSSSSAGTGATARKQPTIFDLGLLGAHVALPQQPADVQAPTGCTDPALLCSTLNQTRSDGSAGIVADVLAGDLTAVLGDSSSTSTSPTPSAGGTGTTPQAGPDFATADLADLDLAGVDLADLADNRSTGTQDGTQGDATLLALLGQELIGAHADSDGKTRDGGSLLELPTCTTSNGLLCASLLYADASASRTDTTRDASTHTGATDACLLGSDATGARCDGLSVGVAQGSSALHSDSAAGTSTAAGSSSLADTCLTESASGACLVSANVLTSSTSTDNKGHSSTTGSAAGLAVDGTALGLPTDPITLTVPTGIMPQLASVLLNSSDTQVGNGVTSAGGTVVGITGLGGQVGGRLASTGASTSDANVVEPPATVDPPTTGNPPAGTSTTTVTDRTGTTGTTGTPDRAGTAKDLAGTTARANASGASDGGVLPSTGGPSTVLLAWGLLLLAMGAMVLTVRRRNAGWV